jgi:uncharacterized membrane protein/rubredoxin
MARLMRCKSCGYVIEEGRLGDVCPACGVPAKLFDPWEDPVSPKRRTVLALDVHPIIVHFPVSFAVSALVAVLFALVFPQVFRQTVVAILRGLILALPVVAAAAIATGLIDGKVRFRKIGTPLLRRKIVLGSLFLASSAAALLLTFLVGPHVTWVRIVDAVLLANCVACSAGLGKIGTGLLCAAMRG